MVPRSLLLSTDLYRCVRTLPKTEEKNTCPELKERGLELTQDQTHKGILSFRRHLVLRRLATQGCLSPLERSLKSKPSSQMKLKITYTNKK